MQPTNPQRRTCAPGREKGRSHPMRTLICDLPYAELESPGAVEPADAAFCLEDLAEATFEQLIGPWDGTAGRLAAALGNSREVWIAARSFHGQASAPVMRALELSARCEPPVVGAGRSKAAMDEKNARPDGVRDLHIWLYGVNEASYEEQGLAKMLAAHLASQLSANLVECRVVDRFDLGLLSHLGALPHNAATPRPEAPRRQEAATAPIAAKGTARAITLLDAGPEGGAPHALLDDFEDALLAYDRLSSRTLGVSGETEPPRFTRIDLRPQDATDASSSSVPACDTLVIGYPVSFGALPSHLVRALGDWMDAKRVEKGTRVYAIGATDDCDPASAHLSLEVLRLLCAHNGLTWGGGLCVAGAAAVASFARSERMGWKRRGRSEATDHLIGAVRAGLTIADAARRFGSADPLAPSNIIDAPCPLPRWIYKLMRDRLAQRPYRP